MGIVHTFSSYSKPRRRTRPLWLVIAFMLDASQLAQAAQEEEPLRWFNYFFDTTTTLVYGVPDSDHTPLFLECERGNPAVDIHVDHEPIRVKDGDAVSVYINTSEIKTELSGIAHYQPMDDLMRVEARMVVDDTLRRILAGRGMLTITIEGQTSHYPLESISEPAAKLMEACLASPDPSAAEYPPAAPAGAYCTDVEPIVSLAAATLHAITEIDLTPIRVARPEIMDGAAPRIAGVDASPDGAMLAFLLPSRDIDFPDQIWLYRVSDHRLVAATPPPAHTPPPYPDGSPAAIKAWAWQDDTLYARIALWSRDGEGEEGTTAVYAATMNGTRRLDTVTNEIYVLLDQAGQPGVVGQDEVAESDWDILDTMRGNADFLVWAYDTGEGTVELRLRKREPDSPHCVVASGGSELQKYLFNSAHSLLIYPSALGINIFDIKARTENVVAHTSGGDQPEALSDDRDVFVWSTQNHCGDEFQTKPARPDVQGLCLAHFGNPARTSAAAGVDCNNATRQIETAVCHWEHIRAFDDKVAETFRAAIAAQKDDSAARALKAEQETWLLERDRRCALDAVTPVPDNEEGVSPQEFGQLNCLSQIYPPRIAHLTDRATPPLVPITVTTLPVDPLRAAYGDRWGRVSYRAEFSPDGLQLALGAYGIASAQTDQLWLYSLKTGQLRVASPLRSWSASGITDKSGPRAWFWGADHKLYIEYAPSAGTTRILAADINGYAETADPPQDILRGLAESQAHLHKKQSDDGCYGGRPRDEQTHGAITAWTVADKPGFLTLWVTSANDEPRLMSSGGCTLAEFILDPAGEYIYHNSDDGLVAIEIATGTKRRVKGTYGSITQTKLLAASPSGDILAFSANGSCSRDAGMEIDPESDQDRRICLAQIRVTSPPGLITSSMPRASDPWTGKWTDTGVGGTSAEIRRGTAKPEYLVIDLVTGMPGCSGAVTLFGVPDGLKVEAKSYDAKQPTAPVCTAELLLDSEGVLQVEEIGDCGYYHGGGCLFDARLTRESNTLTGEAMDADDAQ